MESTINDIDLLLPKKVPKHGKVSGIKKDRDTVRVLIPSENTKLSLTISEPLELLVRKVTPEGKILGLTKFVGKEIYIIDQEFDAFYKETGLGYVRAVDSEDSRKADEIIKEICEKYNIDEIELYTNAAEVVGKGEIVINYGKYIDKLKKRGKI